MFATMQRMQSKWRVGDRLEVAVEALAAGGDGVARVEGCVVFVPLAAPGDRLLVEVERVESRRLHARIVEVLEPASARREPACVHFGRCGGCAWQHVDSAAQRSAKTRIVQDALERLGGLRVEAPIEVRAGDEYGWRTRAQLRVVRDAAGAPALGYLRRASHDVEVVSECPVLAPPLQRALEAIGNGTRSAPPAAAAVRLCAGDSGCATSFADAYGRPVRSSGGAHVAADDRFRVGRFEHLLDAESFFQGNAGMLPALVEAALADLAPREAQSSALDLYCGSGLFTLPLADRFERVLGIESDARAIDMARANAERNGVANARFECADVAAYLERARRVLEPDLVLLDPPRRGAGQAVVDQVAALGPAEVRYVSCDPATLARDLARFAEHGFTLSSVVALDLFPQTPHVECVARMRRDATR